MHARPAVATAATHPDEWIRDFGSLPLMHQPGEQWMYNTGSQVLGVLLERAAGKPLEDFLRERIFEPLGMTDTGFSVSPHQRPGSPPPTPPTPSRMCSMCSTASTTATGARRRVPERRRLAGVDDRRLLGLRRDAARRRHVQRRTDPQPAVGRADDHRPPDTEQRASAACSSANTTAGASAWPCPPTCRPSRVPRVIPRAGSAGTGGTGTTWRSDRARGLTGILFTQRAMTSPEPPAVFDDFWNGAYGAING